MAGLEGGEKPLGKDKPQESLQVSGQAPEEQIRIVKNKTARDLEEKFDTLARGKLRVSDDLKETALTAAARIIDIPLDEVEREVEKLDRQAREELFEHPILGAYLRTAGSLAGQLAEAKKQLPATAAAHVIKHDMITRTVAEALVLHEVEAAGKTDQSRSTAFFHTGLITHDRTPGLYSLLETTWDAAHLVLEGKQADPPSKGATVINIFKK